MGQDQRARAHVGPMHITQCDLKPLFHCLATEQDGRRWNE